MSDTRAADSEQLKRIGEVLLDESRSDEALRGALDSFSKLCSRLGGVRPDRSFDAWADDTFLDSGIALNPEAAAYCVSDYRRSIVFIRAINAALQQLSECFEGLALRVLYAGCGPYATLLLPVLHRYSPGQLDLTLLDIHPRSLNSVARLLDAFGLDAYCACLRAADACVYQHPSAPHLVIAETMQKSLEAEPQVAVTENLGRQVLPDGIFIPQRIDVSLCLARDSDPYLDCISVAPVYCLSAAQDRRNTPVIAQVPMLCDLSDRKAVLATRLTVYKAWCLEAGAAEITLHRKCDDIAELQGGDRIRIEYVPGQYPRFQLDKKSHESVADTHTP